MHGWASPVTTPTVRTTVLVGGTEVGGCVVVVAAEVPVVDVDDNGAGAVELVQAVSIRAINSTPSRRACAP